MTTPPPPAREPVSPASRNNVGDRFRRLINRGRAPVVVGRQAALVKAIAATPIHHTGLRVWTYADAVLTSGRWMCVLEDDTTVYIVEVHPRTGDASVVLTADRRRRSDGNGPGRRSTSGRRRRYPRG